MVLGVAPIHSNFVGEVGPFELTAVSDHDIRAIEDALDRYGVLIFRDQRISAEAQTAFSERFGPLEVSAEGFAAGRFWERNAEIKDERVAEVSNLTESRRPFQAKDAGRIFGLANRYWHTDSTFRPVVAKYTLLSARRVPGEGGETEFADMCAAYDALPAAMKARIEGLKAEHSGSRILDVMGVGPESGILWQAPPAVWPIVQLHPGSGRKTLCIPSHASHVVDWPLPDGRVLLMELREFATQPQFVYRHSWRAFDFLMWDDRSTMHRALPYDDAAVVRELRRTVVQNV